MEKRTTQGKVVEDQEKDFIAVDRPTKLCNKHPSRTGQWFLETNDAQNCDVTTPAEVFWQTVETLYTSTET